MKHSALSHTSLFAAFAFAVGAATLAAGPARAEVPFGPLWSAVAPSGAKPAGHPNLSKLKHLIFIVQENRSFDSYFGTYPGADGIPSPLPCLPSERHPSQCETPYPDHAANNQGGPYVSNAQEADIDGGKMDGFVIQRELELKKRGCPQDPEGVDPDCTPGSKSDIVDVLGYHDGTDLPNYWAYAKNDVLMDHFYESVHAWSQPGHLEIFSGWVAKCAQLDPPDVNSCASSLGGDTWNKDRPTPDLWTDITYLLWQHGVSWGVYLDGGQGPPFGHNGVQGIWNVLPGFQTVQEDGQTANALINLTQFYSDAAAGSLPQVSWVLPQYKESEHPPISIAFGQTYVTGLINAVSSGPDWDSSAIFVVYDDNGGFYDHEPPPFNFDQLGLGVRVPTWLVSPYAKKNYIDHQICSTDCYLKFIEDVFLGGERMSQAGRPDPRPDYRDEEPEYGDIANDFNFTQAPRPPLILDAHPMTMLRERTAPSAQNPAIRMVPQPPR
jgi:phospholipase C